MSQNSMLFWNKILDIFGLNDIFIYLNDYLNTIQFIVFWLKLLETNVWMTSFYNLYYVAFDPLWDPVLEPLLESVFGLATEELADPWSVAIEEPGFDTVDVPLFVPEVCEPGFADSADPTEEPDFDPNAEPGFDMLEPAADPDLDMLELAADPDLDILEPATDPDLGIVEPAADPGFESEEPAVDVNVEPGFEPLVVELDRDEVPEDPTEDPKPDFDEPAAEFTLEAPDTADVPNFEPEVELIDEPAVEGTDEPVAEDLGPWLETVVAEVVGCDVANAGVSVWEGVGCSPVPASDPACDWGCSPSGGVSVCTSSSCFLPPQQFPILSSVGCLFTNIQ